MSRRLGSEPGALTPETQALACQRIHGRSSHRDGKQLKFPARRRLLPQSFVAK